MVFFKKQALKVELIIFLSSSTCVTSYNTLHVISLDISDDFSLFLWFKLYDDKISSKFFWMTA